MSESDTSVSSTPDALTSPDGEGGQEERSQDEVQGDGSPTESKASELSDERTWEETPSTHPDIFPVVGIGASAGGVDAIQSFFTHLQVTTGMAFVVVLHLSPDTESNLTEIIEHVTDLTVERAESGTEVKANHVYVIPPGQKLTIKDRSLQLIPITDAHDATTVDRFFRSLAADLDNNAVGVVLSGTGVDGTIGLRSIREHGGVTMVQSPHDAQYEGMPQSALSTGVIDIIGTTEELADAVSTLAENAGQIDIRPESDLNGEDRRSHLKTIFELLYAVTGHDFSNYRSTMVLRRVERRMKLLNIKKLSAYVDRLHHDNDEVQDLRRDLLISVTNFFRDPDAFEVLEEEVIPRLFEERDPGEPIRVWVTGCATGEEAYSLGILLREAADRRECAPEMQIFATDVDTDALSVGRAGVYPSSISADITKDRLQRFFELEGGHYRVRSKLREMILFAEHDVLSDPPFSNLDLVSCRNLLIYLNQNTQHGLLELLHYGLRPGGYLFLGRSEAAGRTSDLFSVVNKPQNIYKARSSSGDRPKRAPLFTSGRAVPTGYPGGERGSDSVSDYTDRRVTEQDKTARFHQDLVMADIASVLVNENHEIVHLAGGAHRFLQLSGGTPTLGILSCVPEPLRLDLRGALYNTFERNVDASDILFHQFKDDQSYEVEVSVRRVTRPEEQGEGETSPIAWIRFSRRPIDEVKDEEPTSREAELERMLAQTRQQLQTTSEEYQATAEEMEAANEELLSMNEEFQSKNEELQTSKEELQSLNEELKTTNQALKASVDEVKEVNMALETLMASTEIATVFLDRDLRIQRFTPSASELFSIRPTDVDRPLADFTPRLDYDSLLDDAHEVLDSGESVEQEVKGPDDRWMLARCSPYKTDDGVIDGVVFTFVDVTEQRELERAIVNATEREQRRIGQDLHDLLASRLTGASMLLQNLRRRVIDSESEISEEDVSKILGIVHDAAEETRTLSHALVPVALQESNLSVALRILMEEMDDLHAPTFRFIGDEAEAAPENETTSTHLYRIAYEAVNNAIQHAECDKVTVRLFREFNRLILTVSDNGRGISSDTETESNHASERDHGLGLRSMKRRANLIGASFTIETGEGQGTTIRCELPLS